MSVKVFEVKHQCYMYKIVNAVTAEASISPVWHPGLQVNSLLYVNTFVFFSNVMLIFLFVIVK